MNSITAIVSVSNAQKADSSKQVITNASGQIAYIDGKETKHHAIKLTAYGKAGEALADTADGTYLVSGRLQLDVIEMDGYKEKRTTLVITEIITPVAELKPFCQISLIGRTGGLPDTKYFTSGAVVTKLTLAVNRTKEITDWFDLEAWEKTAETISNYCGKGSSIGIIGSIKFDNWQDRNTGANRSKMIIKVSRLDLLQTKAVGAENVPEEDEF